MNFLRKSRIYIIIALLAYPIIIYYEIIEYSDWILIPYVFSLWIPFISKFEGAYIEHKSIERKLRKENKNRGNFEMRVVWFFIVPMLGVLAIISFVGIWYVSKNNLT